MSLMIATDTDIYVLEGVLRECYKCRHNVPCIALQTHSYAKFRDKVLHRVRCAKVEAPCLAPYTVFLADGVTLKLVGLHVTIECTGPHVTTATALEKRKRSVFTSGV